MKKLTSIGLTSALSVLLALGFALSGCQKTVQVYNVKNNPIIERAADKSVATVIMEAGSSLGWEMVQSEEGSIKGRIALRTHSAVIEITYSDTEYSITLIDAQNLEYDKESNTIHRNYNGWIKNLENAINVRMVPL